MRRLVEFTVRHQVEVFNQIIPDAGLDIQPKIDEYRIVGQLQVGNAGISTITASGTTVT